MLFMLAPAMLTGMLWHKKTLRVNNITDNDAMTSENILRKFDWFAKQAVIYQKKLTAEQAITQRLRDEISLSHSVETNLRCHLSQAQDRIIALQKEVNDFVKLKESNELLRQSIEKESVAISNIRKVLTDFQNSVESKIRTTSTEMRLQKEKNELHEKCQKKENEFYLLSMEHQISLKEKDEQMTMLRETIERLESELEETKLEYKFTKNDLDRVNIIHNQTIRDYELTVQQYEKDITAVHGINSAGGNAEDKEPRKVKNQWDKKAHVTWADSVRDTTKKAHPSGHVADKNIQNNSNFNEFRTPQSKTNEPVFKPKSKVQPTLTARLFPPAAKATPLDVHTVRPEVSQQPKKKRLYSGSDDSFLY